MCAMCHMLSYESYKRKLLNNVKHGVEQRLRELMKYLKRFKFVLQRNFNETHSFKFLLYLQLVKPVSNYGLFMRFRTIDLTCAWKTWKTDVFKDTFASFIIFDISNHFANICNPWWNSWFWTREHSMKYSTLGSYSISLINNMLNK